MIDEEKYRAEYTAKIIKAIQVKRFDEAANLVIKGIIGGQIHDIRKNKRKSEWVNSVVSGMLEWKFTLLRNRSFTTKEAATQAFNETVEELMSPAPDNPKKTQRKKTV